MRARGRGRKTGDGAARAVPSSLSIPEQIDAAREVALRLLAVRERSRAELRTRLRQRGFLPDAIEPMLDRLAETGLQDDRRFAERYAEEGVARGKASRLIQGELRRRGVGIETAAAAAVAAPEDELARARSLARSKAARMIGGDDATRARRILGMLARRGYDPETCRRVAAEVSEVDDPELEDPEPL
ncbi:MAG TPA: regulatory protein RecX [Actinomycetota bacterium]